MEEALGTRPGRRGKPQGPLQPPLLADPLPDNAFSWGRNIFISKVREGIEATTLRVKFRAGRFLVIVLVCVWVRSSPLSSHSWVLPLAVFLTPQAQHPNLIYTLDPPVE